MLAPSPITAPTGLHRGFPAAGFNRNTLSMVRVMAKTVMIVIQDDYLRKLVLASLRRIACRIVESRSDEDALNLLKMRLPSILVLDFNLAPSPGNSLDLTRFLLEHAASGECKILVIAGAGQMSKVRGKVTRANEFIAKPFSPIDLRTRIEQLLGSDLDEEDSNGRLH